MFKWKIKKRNILLLEILLALSIVSLCAIPIVRQPILFFRSQIHSLRNMEYERIADLSFLEIKSQLYRNEIIWDKIPKTKKNSLLQPLPPYILEIAGLASQEIERNYYLWWNVEKKGPNNTLYRLIHISIQIAPPQQKKRMKQFSYRVLVQKNNPLESPLGTTL